MVRRIERESGDPHLQACHGDLGLCHGFNCKREKAQGEAHGIENGNDGEGLQRRTRLQVTVSCREAQEQQAMEEQKHSQTSMLAHAPRMCVQ